MTGRRELTFISPRFLFPADSGGKIRTTQILRGLKGGAFNVRLVSPSTSETRSRYAQEIQAVCDEFVVWDHNERSTFLKNLGKVLWLLHRIPASVRFDWNATGAAVVRQSLDAKPDVVVFDFPHSAILAPRTIPVPSVMFTHNIEAEIFERHWRVARFPPYKWIWRDQYRKMRRFEKATLSRFDTIVAVSERDREFFRNRYQVESCHAIPTGVDTDFFRYEPPADRRQVVFCGSMDWMANIDGVEFFLNEIWPSIRRRFPDAKMKVVGRSAPEYLVSRVRASAREWEFTGFVDDVREHICGAAAFVIPLRVGGGTRIKAFEAMAMGVPVVSTSIGIEGLPVIDGEHFLAADDPEEFADRVVRLLDDAAFGLRISESARELVESKYGYRRAARVFEDICLGTIRQ